MTDAEAESRRPRARTLALYLTIAVLAASAVLGAVLIVVGDQANISGRAWLTLLLVGTFAGAVAFDATVANGPNRWYLPASTVTNAVLVAIGLLKLWNGPLQPADSEDPVVWALQIWRFVEIVVLARAALLVTQAYGLRFVTRATSRVSRLGGNTTLALAWATTLVLSLPAIFPVRDWPDWWWRVAGATALVGAVAAVIPLIVRAFEAKPAVHGDRSTGPELRPNPPYPFPRAGVGVPQPGAVPLQPAAAGQPGTVLRQPGAAPQPSAVPPQPQPAGAPPATNAPPAADPGFLPPQ
ncbi:hypothetical protein [Leifsonia sp. EB34]|uniref:hypothetical protein n=1 Tax=Leifsonia sp. EB34 TaxID=3156303 RepID=UPI00351315EC